MLNDGINFLTSFLEKECRRLHEKATALKLIKDVPQTLKAARTKDNSHLTLLYIYSILWPNCILQRTTWLLNAMGRHGAQPGFASGLNQSCGASWEVLSISFLTSAGAWVAHGAWCCKQGKRSSMVQLNLRLGSHPSLFFCHKNPLWWWKAAGTKLFRDGNLRVAVPSLKSRGWACRSTWHAQSHLKSIEAIFWAYEVL